MSNKTLEMFPFKSHETTLIGQLFNAEQRSISLLAVLLVIFITACSSSGTSETLVEVTRILQIPVTVEVTRIVIQTNTEDVQGRISLTGTYELVRTDDNGCILLVEHNELESPFEKLQIELSCNRGAPSFNMGYAFAEILTADSIASYNSEYGECSIVFEFLEEAVKVTQLGESFDCGFGHAVYANGVYQRINQNSPKLGCMSPTGTESDLCEN